MDDLLSEFLARRRRDARQERQVEVDASFKALFAFANVLTTIMRRDRIGMDGFDAETRAKVRALGKRAGDLHRALEKDFPPLEDRNG